MIFPLFYSIFHFDQLMSPLISLYSVFRFPSKLILILQPTTFQKLTLCPSFSLSFLSSSSPSALSSSISFFIISFLFLSYSFFLHSFLIIIPFNRLNRNEFNRYSCFIFFSILKTLPHLQFILTLFLVSFIATSRLFN